MPDQFITETECLMEFYGATKGINDDSRKALAASFGVLFGTYFINTLASIVESLEPQSISLPSTTIASARYSLQVCSIQKTFLH